MLFRHRSPIFFAAMLALLCAPPASALINLNMPIGKIYESVRSVAVATVSSVNSDNRVVELKTTDLLKGPAVGETFRVQIAAPAELVAKITPGQPLVIMTGEDAGKPVALIHIADTWLLAERLPGTSTAAWRVLQSYDAKRSFAGTTAELVKTLISLTTGK